MKSHFVGDTKYESSFNLLPALELHGISLYYCLFEYSILLTFRGFTKMWLYDYILQNKCYRSSRCYHYNNFILLTLLWTMLCRPSTPCNDSSQSSKPSFEIWKTAFLKNIHSSKKKKKESIPNMNVIFLSLEEAVWNSEDWQRSSHGLGLLFSPEKKPSEDVIAALRMKSNSAHLSLRQSTAVLSFRRSTQLCYAMQHIRKDSIIVPSRTLIVIDNPLQCSTAEQTPRSDVSILRSFKQIKYIKPLNTQNEAYSKIAKGQASVLPSILTSRWLADYIILLFKMGSQETGAFQYGAHSRPSDGSHAVLAYQPLL